MGIIAKKICLVGDFAVGKTSLIRRFIDREFSDRYLTTIGVKISRKLIELPSMSVQLVIWDLEGHTRFREISASYLQGASGAIVVADASRQDTVEALPNRLHGFLTVNPRSNVAIALNKSDMVEERALQYLLQRIEPLGHHPQAIAVYPTSAKTGENVDRMFQELAGCMALQA